MKINNIKSIFIVFVIILFSGCATKPKYIVDINSIGSTHGKVKYVLIPASKSISSADLEFQEYSKYIDKALKKKGFIKTNLQNADIVIFFKYGISKPKQYTKTFLLPITSQDGFRGYRSGIKTYILFTRYYELNAVDLKYYNSTHKYKQLWKTVVSSSGSSGDLRRVFPVLVAASEKYIAVNTRHIIEVEIYENDKKVLSLKK